MQEQIDEIKMVVNHNTNHHNTILSGHNQALVALKMQRDIDRKRRLQLLRRLKKEQNKLNLKLKLITALCLVTTLIALFH